MESSRTQFGVLGLEVFKSSKMPILDSRTALFLILEQRSFFFGDHFHVVSLVSNIPALGLEWVGPRKGCSWPRIFFVSLASSFVSSTPSLFRDAIISSGTPNQFLILCKFYFNGDTSTRFLLLVFETFMSKNILPHSKNF